VTSNGVDDVMLIDGKQDGGDKEKTVGEATKKGPNDAKCCKTSSHMVPGHFLKSEDESIPPPLKKQKVNTSMARMMPTGMFRPPDKLWMSLTQCPAPMCDTCEARGLPACVTMALQIACKACHAGKMKCSYSTLHIVHHNEMLGSGKLAAAKEGKKAAPKKKVQDVEGSEVKVRSTKAVGKRKQCKNPANDSAIEAVPSDVVAGRSTS
jgi:hypothetical protein